MVTNISQYLDMSAKKNPHKIAFSNGKDEINFYDLRMQSRALASTILEKANVGDNVAVIMDRTPKMICALLGIWYARCCAVPIDVELPTSRISYIVEKADVTLAIYDEKYDKISGAINTDKIVFERNHSTINETALLEIQKRAVDTDSAYIIFTSGSSGEPKGIILPHRCAINFAQSLSEELGYDESFIFAGQTPLYYIASFHDIMPGLYLGATVYLIPPQIIVFPGKVMQFLSENKVTVLSAVPSVLSILASYANFSKYDLKSLKYILYGGEVLPTMQFKKLKNELCNTVICCCYGLTEVTTTSCLWKSSERELDCDEIVPIGFPLKNTKIFLLDEDDEISDTRGEICFNGTCLAQGYYKEPEQTRKSFCQNPTQDKYPEIIYRTGDIAEYNKYNELVFIGRKDFQIKHGGHRIELGDIENTARKSAGIHEACCVYLDDTDEIVLCYTGNDSEQELRDSLKLELPRYMMPSKIIKLESMPHLSNRKIDRKEVKKYAQ